MAIVACKPVLPEIIIPLESLRDQEESFMTDQPEQTAPTNPSTIRGINHVGMSVRDLNASVDFYTRAVAVEEEPSKGLSNSAAERASGFASKPIGRTALRGPNGYLELSQYDASLFGSTEVLPVQGPGITHVCYQAPTAEDIYSRFKAEGATPVSRGREPISLLGVIVKSGV